MDQLNYESKSGMMDFEGSLGAWSTGSSRIPSLPLKNRRILVGILKHQGIPFALDKHLLTVGICWCVFGVGELSPLQRDRFQLVS